MRSRYVVRGWSTGARRHFHLVVCALAVAALGLGPQRGARAEESERAGQTDEKPWERGEGPAALEQLLLRAATRAMLAGTEGGAEKVADPEKARGLLAGAVRDLTQALRLRMSRAERKRVGAKLRALEQQLEALKPLPAAAVERAPPDPCEGGTAIGPDTAGHCCWPGQAWNEQRCVGLPTSCPKGQEPEGEACRAVPCREGKVSVKDGACCWPGQVYAKAQDRCVGVPQCPDRLVVERDACVPHPKMAFLGKWNFLHAGNATRFESDHNTTGDTVHSHFWVQFTLSGAGELQMQFSKRGVMTNRDPSNSTYPVCEVTETEDWPGGTRMVNHCLGKVETHFRSVLSVTFEGAGVGVKVVLGGAGLVYVFFQLTADGRLVIANAPMTQAGAAAGAALHLVRQREIVGYRTAMRSAVKEQ